MDKTFRSALAPYMTSFLQEKLACGYRYTSEIHMLHVFDRFLSQNACPPDTLPRDLVERWTARLPHQHPRTQRTRFSMISQVARFLRRHGVQAYVPDSRLMPVLRLDFTPYVFTREQVGRLFEAVDRLPFVPVSPERHIVMPEIFRLLYGCGLRAGEALRLCLGEVDFAGGVLTVRQGKFRKDRLVPMTPAETERLRRYAAALHLSAAHDPLFPAPHGRGYSIRSLYGTFRRVLRSAGIPHGGRGQGPRVHDLRHTFAVHCLERWYRQGDNLNARLPLLATYLGHQGLSGTQRYLRLTPTVFPDITARLDAFFHRTLSERRDQP
jgi:integrase